jgi:hypothetical protein
VNAAFNGIKDVVGGVVNFIRDHWQLLVEILTGPIGIAVGLITSHWDTIKNGFTAVKDWIGNRINDIVGFFTALPGRVMGFVTTIWDGIKTGITGAKNWIHDRIEDVVGFVTGLPGRISKAAHGMWDGIKDAFRSAINFIIRGWNSLHFHVPGFSAFGHKIGGFDLGLPPIHELATGGIIRATAGGVFARIGEAGSNEAVIPLNPQGLRPVVDAAIEGFEQYLSSLRGSVGSPVASPQGPMVVQLVMDGVKVGEVLLSNLEQRLKRNGPGVLQLSL